MLIIEVDLSLAHTHTVKATHIFAYFTLSPTHEHTRLHLLLHCFVYSGAVVFVDAAEFVDAAQPAVCENQSPAFEHPLHRICRHTRHTQHTHKAHTAHT